MRGVFHHLLLRGHARRQRLGSVGQGQQRECADAGVTHDVGHISKRLFERGNVGCVAATGESVPLSIVSAAGRSVYTVRLGWADTGVVGVLSGV